MCGRFVQSSSRGTLQRVFDLTRITAEPRVSYNIAPTQHVVAVVSDEGERVLTAFRWGLIPEWAKDLAIGNKLNNARSETVAEKPSFKSAFRSRRCIIPADGFYEWLKQGKEKLPHYFHLKNDHPMAFAGLWERNEKIGEPVATCTILTTEANAVMAPIHHRMPVILPYKEHEHWLDPDAPQESLLTLLRPYEGEDLERYPVSKERVNSTRNDGPELILRVRDEMPSLFDTASEEETQNSR